jgi:chromosome segregation ATPase
MENLQVWLLVLAGATIGLLSTFLLAAERELRNKRLEYEALRRRQTDNAANRPAESESSQTECLQALTTKNKELVEEIASLSSRLEESRRTVEELQTEQERCKRVQFERQQSRETIASLQNQLQTSEIRLSEATGRSQEMVTRNSILRAESVELQKQLQSSQTLIEDLEAEKVSLRDADLENQQLRWEITNLRNQVQNNEGLLNASASQYKEATERNSQLQFEVARMAQQTETLAMKNRDLHGEIDLLSSRLEVSHKISEELQTMQQRLTESQSENERLRAEIQELQRRITEVTEQLKTSESRLGEAVNQAQEMAHRTDKLQTEANTLKQELQASRNTKEELQTDLARLKNAQSENQQLREETVNLKSRLGEANRQNEEVADRFARLQIEVTELKQLLEEGQSKVRELEAVQQRLANAESCGTILKDQQQRLETQIADLQRELSAAKESLQELDAARRQLAGMERIGQEQRDEKRRLEEEICGWQERLAASEDKQRQVSALLQQFHELQTKHAPPVYPSDPFHSEAGGGAQSIGGPSSGLSDCYPSQALRGAAVPSAELAPPRMEPAVAHQVSGSGANSHIDDSGEKNGNHSIPNFDGAATGVRAPEEAIPAPWISAKGRRHVKIIAAVSVLAIAGGVALSLQRPMFSGSDQRAVAPATVADDNLAKRPDREPATASAEPRPAPRLRGSFETIRPTPIYSGPSENSALVGKIPAATKINVVDSRDGWLEVRSKHGRAPGFVREEAAKRIGQN